jgi:hypothetical protein
MVLRILVVDMMSVIHDLNHVLLTTLATHDLSRGLLDG